jgi:hypothetical protein
MPQESSTATAATTTAATATGSTTSGGANDYAKSESHDAQSRAIHDNHLGSA